MSIYSRAQPFICLSPMDGVSDTVMRQMTKKYGAPDLMWTEFVNVEGFHFARKRLVSELDYSENELPLVAQIYGKTPEFFAEATREICERGFAGVDINFGCPAKSVVHSGSGAALIKNPELARQIYQAVRQTTIEYAQEKGLAPLPVSIKTRIGYEHNTLREWVSFLLELAPELITIHGRTLKQGYTGEADWAAIAEAVELRERINPTVKIFGNGDIKSLAQAKSRIAETKVEGVLIGRAAIGNPWVFTDYLASVADKKRAALEHCRLFEQTYRRRAKYSFAPMRKHLAAYMRDFPNASQLRTQLMQMDSSAAVERILAA